MVNFENGTLVTNAYVEINGVQYPVVMPVYSGNTPLTAENLNKAQNDLYNQNNHLNKLQFLFFHQIKKIMKNVI